RAAGCFNKGGNSLPRACTRRSRGTCSMTRILIVEDNDDLARGLANNLEIEGFETEIASDGASGLERARETSPDLVILDLMLPAMDGYRVLSSLRDEGDTVPVLVLTARTSEHD